MQRLILIVGFAVTAVACAEAVCAAETALNGHNFRLPDGFAIELVASSPLVDRPICADFDEQGRLYVADSSGSNDPLQQQLIDRTHRIVRLEDTDGDGRFDRSIVFADRMMFPEGALWHDGALYVAAPPSIWKLTDTDGDGQVDRREEWFQGKTLTHCGNDLHGPYLGPDGWIYWCKGAFAEQTYERPTGPPLVTRAAHIFRCRPDAPRDPQTGSVLTSAIEPVMTGGMDNPVEVAFGQGGERFFTTTFLVNPAGGLRDGLIHAVYGGVYGKQQSAIDGHTRTGELMPVLTHLGAAAPSGLAAYRSDKLGRDFTGNLFACLFNMRKVTRHVLEPNGASFRTSDSDFLVSDNVDFHPTDVLEDADGSLLVIDTGGWFKLCCPTSQLSKPDVLGGIYRIRRPGATREADPRGLELNWSGASPAELALLLDDRRPAVRQRAVQELGLRGDTALPALRETLTQSPSARARNGGVWALARIDGELARALTRIALDDADETVLQAAVHSISAWRDAQAVERLAVLLRDGTVHNRRVAAEALGRIGDASAVPTLLAAADAASDRVLQHSLTYALIEIGDAAALGAGLNASSPGSKAAALIALDQLEQRDLLAEKVVPLLTSSEPVLRETAGWIVDRHPEWGPRMIDYFAARLARAQLSPDERRVLQNRLSIFAESDAVQGFLADSLNDAEVPDDAKSLVLAAMAQTRLSEMPPRWIDALSDLLTGTGPGLQRDAIAALRQLPTEGLSDDALAARLVELGHNEANAVELRLQAMAAVPGGLDNIDDGLFQWICQHLEPSHPVTLRVAAIEVLEMAQLTPPQFVALAAHLKTVSPLEVDGLLAVFERTSDERVGLSVVAALSESPARSALRVESLQPRLAHFPDAVQQQAQRLFELVRQDNAGQHQRLEDLLASLPDGDVRRGQGVFHSSQAACSACHAIGYLGGNTGPDLTHIGRIRSNRDLIEAVVFPSASLVRSFESVTVATVDGRLHNGLVSADSARELVLTTGPNQQVRIARDDIEAIRQSDVSIMPAGLDKQLSLQELADLVEFLEAAQ